MKKGLIAVLITANLLMLVIGIFTIPPNLPKLWGAAEINLLHGTKLAAPVTSSPEEETPPATPVSEKETASVTPPPEEETPPAVTEGGSTPAPEKTGVSLSTENALIWGLSLVH